MADTIEKLQAKVDELESKVEETENERDEALEERYKFETERDLWEEYAIDLGDALDTANDRLAQVHDAVSPNAGSRDDAQIDEPTQPKGI